MTRYDRAGKVLVGLCVAVLGALSGGCSDPEAAEMTAVRQDRMRGYLDRWAERERDGPRRIERTLAVAERAAEYRAEHLRLTLELMAEWWRHGVERWSDQARYRQAIRAHLEGDPAGARRAVQRMFY